MARLPQFSPKWWFINGIRYNSRSHAARELGVSPGTIKCWCNGWKDKYEGNPEPYIYPPKFNCYSVLKDPKC